MGRCEVCGNEYDKSFEVTVAGTTPTRQLRVRHPRVRPHLRELRVQDRRPRRRGRRPHLRCAHCAEQGGVGGLKDRV